MKISGLHHLIYLIEGTLYSQYKVSKETVETAIIHTQIQDDFMVKETSSIDGTVKFLTNLHRNIQKKLKNLLKNTLVLPNPPISFNNYVEYIRSMKDLRLNQYFIQQLRQINGIGSLQAKSITQKYPTLQSLWKAYKQIDNEKDKRDLIKNIKINNNKKFGKVTSTSIYNLFNE